MKQSETAYAIADVGEGASSLMNNLPIAKHFNGGLESALKKANSGNKTEMVWNIVKAVLVAGVGYMTWLYVLPPLFMALGKMTAVFATIVGVIAFVLALPAIFKWSTIFARKLKRAAIKHDPFLELEKQEVKIVQNQKECRAAKQRIKGLEVDMQTESKANEKKAETLQGKILTLKRKAVDRRSDMTALEKEHGPKTAKGTDDYVNANAQFLKIVSESQRTAAQLTQAKDFIVKYGSRAAVMKKMVHKLTMVEVVLDNKVHDFRASVDILKNDYEFANKSRTATDAAKAAMLFDKSWELELAIDTVATTIAYDIAQTAGNFHDIGTLTANFDLDSDEMFAQLDTLAESITAGSDIIPDADKYKQIDYELTQTDDAASGGFGSIF